MGDNCQSTKLAGEFVVINTQKKRKIKMSENWYDGTEFDEPYMWGNREQPAKWNREAHCEFWFVEMVFECSVPFWTDGTFY